MQKIIIIVGPMGAGKTVYAKGLAQELGYEYLYFDDIFSRMFGNNFEPFLNYLATKLNSSNKNFVMDGWFAWYEKEIRSVKKLGKVLKNRKIEWIYLFAPKWIILDRYKNKKGENYPEIEKMFEKPYIRSLPSRLKNCRFIDATDFDYEECSNREYEKRVQEEITKNKVEKFLNEIRAQEPYQNIQLPFGFATNGYTDCEKSWSQIKPLIDWKGKSVLDVSCYWGYFCFEIKDEGAREVIGTDNSEDVVKTARKIRNMKKINVIFKKHDIENEEINREYDVILLLNSLHHLRSPFHVLREIFKKGKTLILEVELPWDKSLRGRPTAEMGAPIKLSEGSMGGHLRFSKEMIMRFASENGHFLKKETESMRPNRTILLFERG